MNLKTITLHFLLTLIWASSLVAAPQSGEEQPALFYADSQTYDRELGILILKGHVEFEHQGSVLEADYVTYNENTDIVTASGNVRLRQPNGDINFAEYVELTGDMKKGVILCMRTLMEDDSKLAALEGRKFEDREELEQAVYTPCKLCGDKPPSWQINARRAVKDDVNKNIHFTDAHLRFFDIPVLYIPYSTQPLERRSGFLIPRPGYSTDFGANVQTPYFFALSRDKDLTLAPVFFTDQNPLVYGDYRQAFGNGIFKTEGSIIDYKKSSKDKKVEKTQNFKIPNTRGHFFANGKFDLNDVWRFRAFGGVVSDKTFFRKFRVSGWQKEPYLSSQAALEGFLSQRDYAAASMTHFQGFVNADQQKRISKPIPYLEYNGYSGTDPLGGRFNFDGNILNLVREKGINVQRGIGVMSWKRPLIIPLGQVFTFFGSTRGDLYQVENFQQRRRTEDKKGGARFFPQSGIDWRWPFVNSFCSQSFVVQPMAQLIGAPRRAIGIAQRRIPNEDSAGFEFNDANLFSSDRFPGYDVIDRGSRAVYGGEILTVGGLFGNTELFLGQSYSLTKPRKKEESQGLGRKPSDYVGRIEASPFSWLTVNYRFRMDKETWNTRVAELGGAIGPALAKLSGNYLFISKKAGTGGRTLDDFQQLSLQLSSQLTEHWLLSARLRHDFRDKKDGGGRLEEGVGVFYRDDCFGLGTTVTRQFYRDRDLRPATLVLVTLFLKNVGSYGYAVNLDRGLLGDRDPKDVREQKKKGF